MAVNKKLKNIFTSFFEVPEVMVANMINNVQERVYLSRYRDRTCKLTKAKEKEIIRVWKPFKKISTKWVKYYYAKNNLYSPYYIPNDLYYSVIDQYFNKRRLGYGFNDKNYYSKIFEDIQQPNTLVRKISGLLFDSKYNQISIEEGLKIIQKTKEIICKPSQESGSGRGIEFIKTSNKDKLSKILSDDSYDNCIIQALLTQHPALSKIHSSSINSVRICSLLMPDGVKILSAVLRMGVGNSRVDNATSGENAKYDGISVGINEDGTLKKYSYGYYKGERMERHPGGLLFEGYKIPSFENAVNLVKKAHPRLGHFRLVSWDIAIDGNGTPVLIEANMRKGGINFHQFNNGPLFENIMYEPDDKKNLTVEILKEVFHK